MSDVLIIGAGINGLLTARELLAEGAAVMLLDKGRSFSEASWAGGGIVSPLYPWRYSAGVTALASWAQDFYPALTQELLSATGIDPELVRSGLLMLDARDEVSALQWARSNQRSMDAVDPDFIYAREPQLAPGFRHGLWMPDVSNVRNPRLGEALLANLRQHNRLTLIEGAEVRKIHRSDSVIESVAVVSKEAEKRIKADKFVICAGAWSAALTTDLQFSLPVTPVKGQMLLYKPAQRLVNSIVLSNGRYVIPRGDGHLLVGSTLEHCGFDKSVTAAGRDSLQESAQSMLPALASIPLKAQWSGLRPGSPDGTPFIGKLPACANGYINAGQYRNGLVLAPASARLLVDLMLKRQTIVDPEYYDPQRLVH